ncbi:MAG: hypothetical protein KF749_12025 [Bacteroidetes bacterium]|nr:hypothetical protein [Bacteroidota bacterium]MCW5894232.1 hypothetical protein [Bacteroidota bacterium]
MIKNFCCAALLAVTLLPGCRNNNVNNPVVPPPPQSDRGVFIINEGAWPNPGSVSFYNISKDSVFASVIGPSAGWITPNDGRVVGGKLYVVVNGGDKIYIRNAETFQALDSIALPSGSGPGYLAVVDSTRAYVANYNGTVSLVNLATRTVVRTGSPIVTFPGGIAVNGDRVFISDYGFFPGFSNIVKVLDGNSLAVVDSVRVGLAAGSMVSSGNRVYVVCANSFPAKGKVFALNASNASVVDSITVGDGPSDIAVRNQTLYVLHYDHVMRLGTNPLSVGDSLFIRISNAIYFYSMQADDVTGDVYVSQVVSGGGAGEVLAYTSAGVLKRPPFNVGIFPGSIVFK